MNHENPKAVLEQFENRLFGEWLPAYCGDPGRRYSIEGFDRSSLKVGAADARDFMRAVDQRLVACDSGGRFTAPRSMATEVIFWEHERNVVPRRITLWLEPVVTIACIARLHFDFGWPVDCLGLQSVDYSFDLVAYLPGQPGGEHVAGEVKPTGKGLGLLLNKLRRCCNSGPHDDCLGSGVRKNAHRKWQGLNRSKAPLFWAIGPDGDSRVFRVGYRDGLAVSLEPADPEIMRFPPRP